MIAINESVTEDIGSGPGAVERDELPEDPHLSLTWLQMTVKRLEGSLIAKDREIAKLEAKLATSEGAATEWNRCIRHRDETASWLIDQAFTDGKQVKYTVDAALGGTDFIPCSHECDVPESILPGGRKVKLELLETVYSVTLVD